MCYLAQVLIITSLSSGVTSRWEDLCLSFRVYVLSRTSTHNNIIVKLCNIWLGRFMPFISCMCAIPPVAGRKLCRFLEMAKKKPLSMYANTTYYFMKGHFWVSFWVLTKEFWEKTSRRAWGGGQDAKNEKERKNWLRVWKKNLQRAKGDRSVKREGRVDYIK